ncbi:hypothetical protein CUJ83_06870 [Methanocella sp. CWC-04]|uniref:J domain-containing protein n=1 Tax=Methanooceanicella nereidis TaxID=2052831 RepID=A0AAP2W6Y7_9EURY|nr:J domain-containing protein [Methanocella sp. CWC-04]MCD1294719.1 hypothetical protein [Methanocella sp. CWC-04]
MATYYDILGLSKDCDQEEIKRAYHRLALEYHPDKNSSSDAGEKMRLVNEAYRVLSDPQKREDYDTTLSSPYPQWADAGRYNDARRESGTGNYYWSARWGGNSSSGYGYGYSAPHRSYRYYSETIRGPSIFTLFYNAFMIGVACGLFIGAAMVASQYFSFMNVGPALAILLAVSAIIAPACLSVALTKSSLNGPFEAGLLGTISVSAALFVSVLIAGISNPDLLTYYLCLCCVGPWACIFIGWLLGSRTAKIFYGMITAD